MVARLATVSRTGRPHVNPIYFVLSDGRIHLGTVTGTLAARNVRANPAVQILFEVESNPTDRRILRMEGTAVIRTEPALCRNYRRHISRKYFRSLPGLWMSLAHLRQLLLTRSYLFTGETGSRHCVIEVEPTSVEMLVASA